MKTVRKRPLIKIHAHYDGKQPLADAYADVFALILDARREKAKSSIRTFDSGKPFHYDLSRNQKECERNGTTD